MQKRQRVLEPGSSEQPKLPKLPDLPTTPGGFTTMAVGEEDGGEQPKLPEPDPPRTPSNSTTVVVGEEDGTTTTGGV
jgi:hypothetical protein